MTKNTTIKKNQLNKDLCHRCDACCRYIATEIDKPTTLSEIENIYWFLLHQNVGVYIGFNNQWYLEFQTPCRALKNKLCTNYDRRPKICRAYKQSDCTNFNNGPTEKYYFHNEKEFFNYIKEKFPKRLWITLVDAKKM